MIKTEIRIFFTALMFFTRLPCPRFSDHSSGYLAGSSRYFPLVGIIVGAIGALAYYLASFVFPHAISIVLSLVATILSTGAFHEDGLADVCDGFGGGWKKDDILRIMKDSRVGAFGVIGLCCTLALKLASLYYIAPQLIPLVLVSGHALSRFAASTLLYTHDYVRDDAQAKARPAAGRMSTASLLTGAVFGIAPLALFPGFYGLLLLIPVFLMRWHLGRYFKKWIGGQTGDCGGATQQLCELIFYMSCIVLWKFTSFATLHP